MTAYYGSIDRSPAGQSKSINCIAGSGGVTKGKAVKYDGTTARTVVACSAAADIAIGIANNTAAEGAQVQVFISGSIVETAYTLTVGARVGLDGSGDIVDYSADTSIGVCVTAGTTSSDVLINIGY